MSWRWTGKIEHALIVMPSSVGAGRENPNNRVAELRQSSVIYSGRGRWSASKNAVNTFLLSSPAVQESPAQTSLFGRSPGCESSLDFMNHFSVVHPVGASLSAVQICSRQICRSWLAPVGSAPASLPSRLSNHTTCLFFQSFTCLNDVVLGGQKREDSTFQDFP